MKFFRIFLIITLLLFPFLNYAQPVVKFEKTYTEVCFTNNQNIESLAQAQKTLSEKGVHLNYDDLKFGKDGKLIAIEYHVTAGRVSASDKTNEKNFAIGFILNQDPNGKYGIIAGTKDQIEKRRIDLEEKD